MPGKMTGWLIVMLFALAALPLVSTNMFLPSLDVMAGDFGVSYGVMAWAVSGFLLVSAVFQIFAGQAADRFGRRPVLAVCLGIFALASLGSVLSTGFETFMVFRILQASVVAGIVMSRAIVTDLVPKKDAASLFGYIAVGMSLAPMLGPMAGGMVGEVLGWRSIFWLYTVAGFILMFFIWFRMPETGGGKRTTATEFLRDYFKLMTTPLFWGHSLILALAVGGFFIFVAGIPLVAAREFGFDQFEIGIAIGSITGGFLVGSAISGRVATRFDLEQMILAGRIAASTGAVIAVGCVLAGLVTPYVIFGSILLVGFGNGITNPSGNVAVMSVNPKLAASAAGLSGAALLALGGVLTAVTGFLINTDAPALALTGLIAAVTLVSLVLGIWVSRYRV